MKKKTKIIIGAAVVLLALFVLGGVPRFLGMMLSTSTYTKVIDLLIKVKWKFQNLVVREKRHTKPSHFASQILDGGRPVYKKSSYVSSKASK